MPIYTKKNLKAQLLLTYIRYVVFRSYLHVCKLSMTFEYEFDNHLASKFS